MSKFQIGDKIKVKSSGKTGVIKAIYDGDMWNMSDNEYGVEFDDGSGIITIVERVLQPIDFLEEIKCECGVGAVNGNKHSDYCPLYSKFD